MTNVVYTRSSTSSAAFTVQARFPNSKSRLQHAADVPHVFYYLDLYPTLDSLVLSDAPAIFPLLKTSRTSDPRENPCGRALRNGSEKARECAEHQARWNRTFLLKHLSLQYLINSAKKKSSLFPPRSDKEWEKQHTELQVSEKKINK